MSRKIVIREQNGAWWQVTIIDLDVLESDGEETTTNDNGWKRVAKLVENGDDDG